MGVHETDMDKIPCNALLRGGARRACKGLVTQSGTGISEGGGLVRIIRELPGQMHAFLVPATFFATFGIETPVRS